MRRKREGSLEQLVLQDAKGEFVEWVATNLVSLSLLESDLEAAIVSQPGALVLSQIDDNPCREFQVFTQIRLSSPAGHKDIPDVILLTDGGDIVVIEVKRLGNPELRGRSVIAQVVGYAATLASMDEASLVSAMSKRRHTTWDALCASAFPNHAQPQRLARIFRQRLERADLSLVVACDEAPPALTEWIRAAGRQSALGFDLHAIEIRPFVPYGASSPIAWLPALRVQTEIIHRTSVVVRTEGRGEVYVDVHTDSGEMVDEAQQSTASRSAQRRVKSLDVLQPLAAELAIEPDALWAELAVIHEAACNRSWAALHHAIGTEEDAGPYLRGRKAGPLEGRYGVNLLRHWTPSIFVGAYLRPFDHKEPLIAPDTGGDFALILDVDRRGVFDGDTYVEQPAFAALRARLNADASGWDFADHLSRTKCNRWHPLYLRKPLSSIFAGTTTAIERQERWMTAADEAIAILLSGGELEMLCKTYVADQLAAAAD